MYNIIWYEILQTCKPVCVDCVINCNNNILLPLALALDLYLELDLYVDLDLDLD